MKRINGSTRRHTVMVVFFLCITHAASQSPKGDERVRIGILGDYAYNMHRTDFRAFPGVPNCCPDFQSGSGSGFVAGPLVRLPLAAKWSLDVGLTYGNHNALLSATEATLVGRIQPDSSIELVNGRYEHTIDTRISSIGLEPIVHYAAFGSVSVSAGIRIGYVLSGNYSQQETIVEPADARFFSGTESRTRNVNAGRIPNMNTLTASLIGGIHYSLSLSDSGTICIEPEVLLSLGITNAIRGLPWKMNALRGGIRISIPLPKTEAPLPPIPKPVPAAPLSPSPKPAESPAALNASISARAVESGTETPLTEIRSEEFVSTQARPLLHYLFFDDNSAALRPPYRILSEEQTKTFRIDDLHQSNTLDVYYHVLNIIGERMRRSFGTRLTIVGTVSKSGSEAGNTQLARRRAETVKKYLQNSWGIAPARLTVQTRDFPEKPSLESDPEGIEENRRVELYSDTRTLLDPVRTENFEYRMQPSILRFRLDCISAAGLTDWKVNISRKGRDIRSFEGTGTLPETIDWELTETIQKLIRAGETVDYILQVRDKSSQTFTTPEQSARIEKIPVEMKRARQAEDTEIKRYGLILFDFDKADLNEANQRVVQSIRDDIQTCLAKNASVTVTGYTDRIGEEAYNQKLSEDRAKNTAKALKLTNAKIEGMGKSELLFDNGTPEGRFYCRTVSIVVETPIK